MSQQTFNSGGTQLAEPPAPVLPSGDSDSGGDDNRRKLMIVGAAVGVLVLGIVAFFLMKGGSSSNSDQTFTITHHPRSSTPTAAQPPVVKLPKHVAAPVGRDPFKALYEAPAAAPAGPSTTTAGSGSTQTSTGGSTTPTTSGTGTTPTTVTYRPVWVQMRALTSTAATFDVGYSNGKTLKAIRYSGIKPLHTFASRFELLSIRNGVATVKYGDGTPFQLDRTHNTMVVG